MEKGALLEGHQAGAAGSFSPLGLGVSDRLAAD